MFCKIHGAAVYIQHAPVVLETFFQAVQMIQLLRILPHLVCDAADPDIVQMLFHICAHPRDLLQVTDRDLPGTYGRPFALCPIVHKKLLFPIMYSWEFFCRCSPNNASILPDLQVVDPTRY